MEFDANIVHFIILTFFCRYFTINGFSVIGFPRMPGKQHNFSLSISAVCFAEIRLQRWIWVYCCRCCMSLPVRKRVNTDGIKKRVVFLPHNKTMDGILLKWTSHCQHFYIARSTTHTTILDYVYRNTGSFSSVTFLFNLGLLILHEQTNWAI